MEKARKKTRTSTDLRNIIIVTLLLGVAIAALIPGIIVSFKGNIKSLQYLDYFLSGQISNIPEPIPDHLISQILYGQALLEEGDIEGAFR